MKKLHLRKISLSLGGMILASCTAYHEPAPYLPARDSIVAGETVTVDGSQNVYAVAQKYKVSMRDIIVLNHLQAPFNLKPGQSLLLPAGASLGENAGHGAIASATAVEAVPISPVVGTASSAAVATGSSLAAASVQTEELPPPIPASSSTPNKAGPVETLNTPTEAPKPVPTTVASSKSNATTSSQSTPVSASQVAAVAAPTSIVPASTGEADQAGAATDVNVIWPVQGPILSGFGPKGQGLNNDGVNIGAPKGAPVVAAANGIVVYAGNEMKGFGNLILIRHEGGLVTAYAHLDRMLVTKDAVVAQGDMIGTVGKTGNVSTPQLHFEVRQKDRPIDPKTVIKD